MSGLSATSTYKLTAWVASAYWANPAQLKFRAAGQDVGTVLTAPAYGGACPAANSPSLWSKLEATFVAAAPSALIQIGDVTTGSYGNDFVIDDITVELMGATQPAISLTPSSLNFAATQGGSPSPAGQTVAVANSGGGTLTWSATVLNSPSWLTITTSASNLTATVSSAALAAGAYSATIRLSAANASNTPQDIPVTLTVNPAGGTGPVLVGHWKFDEASGATTLDSSGTSPASNGTILGTTSTRVPGKYGTALSLGASSVVDLGNPTALRVFTAPPSVSVSAWVKSTSASVGWRSVVAWDSGSGDYYKIEFNRAGGAVFHIRTQLPSSISEILYSASLADDNWHLLTGTYSGATRTQSLYVDGVLRQSVVLAAGAVLEPGGSGDQKVYIGGQQNNDSPRVWEYLNATVDDVRIYDGAITASDVSALFNATAGAPAAPSGLAATRGNAQIALSWNASSGATSYNVKRATASGGPYTTIASGVTATSYTNTGLTNGTVYYFVVSAVNGSGESANSPETANAPFAPFKDDFEPATLSFTSQYTYAAPAGSGTLYNGGLYSVVPNPNNVHNYFCHFGDHTTGTGKMMVVNANTPVRSVWTKTISGLAVNQTYTLSLWVASAYHANPSQLQFRVNGADLTPTITAPAYGAIQCPNNGVPVSNAWQKLDVTFQAPATSVTIDIMSLGAAADGNDFALDDVELK